MLSKELITALVNSDEAVSALAEKSREELGNLLGGDFAVMKDFAQNNPHHCYDLLNHTVHTVLNVSRGGLSDEDFTELRIAALFHDIGKPRVARRKGGKTVFYNHSSVSAEIASELLPKAGITGTQAERILFYIRHHDDFINYKFENPQANPYFVIINEENLRKLIRKNMQKCADAGLTVVPDAEMHAKLSLLCAADAGAQSEEAVENGRVVDTRRGKLERAYAVRDVFIKIAEE